MGIINVSKRLKTNADALIDRTTFAETDIDPQKGGVIKIDGEMWLCKPIDEKFISEGKKVRVVKLDGVTLYVKEV